MKRILLASPIRSGVSPTYVRSLMNLLFSKMNTIGGGPQAPYSFQWAATSGTTVAMARDELANVAITGGYEEIVYWDIDLHSDNPNMQLALWQRLLSHDVDIVGGQYVGHNFTSKFHGAVVEDSQVRKDGLLEMAQIPLGFSKIKVSALMKIKAALPWHRYMIKQTDDKDGKPDMFEFFPNGLVGPCTGEGKLERIKDALLDYGTHAANFSEYLEKIHAIIKDDKYESTVMLGEDYFFCKLARDCGIRMYIDNNMIVPHESHLRLPVSNSTVLSALSEEWRWGDNVTADEVEHLIAGLKTRLAGDHI